MDSAETDQGQDSIAIVGMSGRFPGARNIAEFWQNLRDGVECISFFSDEELESANVYPALRNDPNYVKAGGVLEDVELFDAAFFGFNPREAESIDPQQRAFLECAYETLENAGYDPETYKGLVGVYGGVSMSTYLLYNLYSNREFIELMGGFQVLIGNDKDFLSTRTSYKLNLRGPSVTIQTACSTSLVAVCMACQGLLNYETDLALAGGVAIRLPQKEGYLYRYGGISSPDGHCRVFDAKAQGTVSGNGVGIVALKRLADALDDGDNIHAVIKGFAINNDGHLKAGYTAPSVQGQAEVIATAHATAGFDPETITYVEAHGTATPIGDPIEIAALTQVFRASTDKKGYCAVGSVKSNVGHLDAAAGVSGLIKTALALQHKSIPPSLHYEQPNPAIDFANSPFYVNSTLSEWKAGETPRRAGVSSFGIGGTNAHVLLEEAPARQPPGPGRPYQLLLLSARTGPALDAATTRLTEHLKQHRELSLADVAYTCHSGRKAFSHRRMLVCRDLDSAVAALETLDPKQVHSAQHAVENRPVAFMFPGQGAQQVNMGRELYESEPLFREQVDICAEILKADLGIDLRTLLYPPDGQEEEAAQRLGQTSITQPVLFTIEYALARLWMEWGVEPQAMIGHSIGEYVAACLSGVFSLEDALSLVALRGKMIQQLPSGAMLAVPLSEEEVRPLLGRELSLAATNGPGFCTVSGPINAVDALLERLTARGVECRRLHTSHAFHSEMMDPILDAFAGRVAKVKLHQPQIPYVSNVTGTWITAAEATDPGYWARHLRQTVRFAEGVGELLKEPARVLLEVGPGQTLSTLARQQLQQAPQRALEQIVLNSLPRQHDKSSDLAFLLNTVGRLWLAGVQVDAAKFYAGQRRYRVPLPPYPFERQRHWVEPQGQVHAVGVDRSTISKDPDITNWFYVPVWRESVGHTLTSTVQLGERKERWVLFVDACGVGSKIATRLEREGQEVITVQAGEKFERRDDHAYVLNPQRREDYDTLLEELHALDKLPHRIVHLWNLSDEGQAQSAAKTSGNTGLYSLLFLAQAVADQNIHAPLQIGVVSSGTQEVTGEEPLCPEKAAILGLCKVIPQESPNITCRSIDIRLPTGQSRQAEQLDERLVAELAAPPTDLVVAYRGNRRWVQDFEAVKPTGKQSATRLRQGGVYLITGGLGAIGLTLAEHLAKTLQARLVLVGRSTFLAREGWENWRATHDPQDDVSLKIEKLELLEEIGAQVMVISADVADREQMRRAIDEACERFGEINGVIHAAGVTRGSSFRAFRETTQADFEAQFMPKAHGLSVLEEALHGRKLDFCLLFSSLSAILGGFGFASYASANAYMDAFAHKHNRTGDGTWVSVNWEGWKSGNNAEPRAAVTGQADLALTASEGAEVLERILSLRGLPEIVISTGDLQSRIDRWVKLESLRGAEEPKEEHSLALHTRPNLANDYVPPRNNVERAIADIWCKSLGIEGVGIYDDFFELGGHSLLAAQIVARLREAFQVNLPLRSVFESPTVEGLAASIEALKAEERTAAPPILPAPRDGHLPLSYPQQQQWFLDQLALGNPIYNVPVALRITGSIDAAVLERVLSEIVRRHEVLRTTFSVADGQPVQVIAPALALDLPTIDLRHAPAASRETEAQRLIREEMHRPFDLARGPLFRAMLLRLEDAEHVLVMAMPHIVTDGWSMGILFEEMAALTGAFLAGAPSPLPDLPIQYADFAYWQRKWMEGEAYQAHLSYWKDRLSGAPVSLDLHTDHLRPPVQHFRGATEPLNLSLALTDALKDFSQREGVTLFMTLMAAFKTLLHRYTHQDDIVVGTFLANRNHVEMERMIGYFVNSVALRTDFSGNPSFRQLLKQVRETALGGYAHQDVPFDLLLEELRVERPANRTPLFQVAVNLQNFPVSHVEMHGLTVSLLENDMPVVAGGAQLDLTLNIKEFVQGLGL
ncbi:MAG TPA: SDR family NAD(P)-dependent oxidoreductase, partial [Chloroflexia bacterium]|nr:SDR family NAD(P)-dependent oxidoreductase [Chloroflexia bacterium]